MIQYTEHTLNNGLKIILHPDDTVQTVAVNLLYGVGARNEDPGMTGMAHLFEHLMFTGSKNAPDYDDVVQEAGGENNAYTTNDYTNYYITLPHQNLETALWLEADRMGQLNLNFESLDVQKKVVIEEFKEHYINKPYGDVWKLFRELCYTTHPYNWMTIGKEIDHIEKVQLKDALDFYKKFYSPQNAILCIAGKFNSEETLFWCEKYFGAINSTPISITTIENEPEQNAQRTLEVSRDVPSDALLIGYPMPSRLHNDFYKADIISDILGSGKTALLYQEFVKNKQTFTEISCYHTGSVDNGLFVIEGKLSDSGQLDEATNDVLNFIEDFKKMKISELELQKIKNRIESLIVFEDIQILNRATNLAYYTWLGDINRVNNELDHYNNVQLDSINSYISVLLDPNKSNILKYKKA